MATQSKASGSKRKSVVPEIPVAEWIASGIGMLLVGFAVGYMIFAAVTQEDRPPEVHVEVLSIEPLRHGYLVKFQATNHGDESVSGVNIVGTAGEGPNAEESEAVIDYLPGSAKKGGGLFFTREPSPASLSLRATGYQEP